MKVCHSIGRVIAENHSAESTRVYWRSGCHG